MSNQELPMSKQNLALVPIQQLLQIDQVFRAANTLEEFLRDCNVRQQTWNRAIQILRDWTEIQEAIIRYVLYRDKPARERAITSLRTLLSNLGNLVRFTLLSEKLPTIGFICETQLDFEEEAYRYLGFDKPIFCLIPFSTQPSPNDFEAIVSRIHKTNSKLNIILVLTLGSANSVRPVQRKYSDYSIILLDEYDVKKLIFADNAKLTFKQLVVRDINLERIQPYSPTGINLSMFYNRDVEKGRILDTPKRCYAIFGPRRIGKTFLLRAVEQVLAKEQDYRVFYFSCQKCIPGEIRSGLLKAIGVTQRRRDSDNFETLVKGQIQRSGKKFVFLLDEVDALVAKAAQEEQKQFFISLRNLHNELQERCRFLFAGFQTLESQLDDYYSPFYNFA